MTGKVEHQFSPIGHAADCPACFVGELERKIRVLVASMQEIKAALPMHVRQAQDIIARTEKSLSHSKGEK